MFHLIKYNCLIKLRSFELVFWPLAFPMLLGLLFYFSFGSMDADDFRTVPVSVVIKEENAAFETFLDEIENGEDRLIEVARMTQEDARRALEEGEIEGIYECGETPSLMVAGSGMEESILQIVLESYESSSQILENIAERNPQKLEQAVSALQSSKNLVRQVSFGGKTMNGNLLVFYALLAMTCLYGGFVGLESAESQKANLRGIGKRNCVSPIRKWKRILAEMLSACIFHILNTWIVFFYLKYILRMEFGGDLIPTMLVLLFWSGTGVCIGILIGSMGKKERQIKVGILLGVSMTFSVSAGLVSPIIKNTVDSKAPFVNWLNPAAWITNAMYYIHVYDSPGRLVLSILVLGGMCLLLMAGAFLAVREEQYESV